MNPALHHFVKATFPRNFAGDGGRVAADSLASEKVGDRNNAIDVAAGPAEALLGPEWSGFGALWTRFCTVFWDAKSRKWWRGNEQGEEARIAREFAIARVASSLASRVSRTEGRGSQASR